MVGRGTMTITTGTILGLWFGSSVPRTGAGRVEEEGRESAALDTEVLLVLLLLLPPLSPTVVVGAALSCP